jgi:hypothetical protein
MLYCSCTYNNNHEKNLRCQHENLIQMGPPGIAQLFKRAKKRSGFLRSTSLRTHLRAAIAIKSRYFEIRFCCVASRRQFKLFLTLLEQALS